MLGQHPQMYALPEMQLFLAETVARWWQISLRSTAPATHGALRTVAQLYFGEQTVETVKLARGWLWRRSHFSTGFLLEVLATKVQPRILVDKTSIITYRPEFLRRAYRMFPKARFIHLVRHPLGYGESVVKFLKERTKNGPLPSVHWLARLAYYPSLSAKEREHSEQRVDVDPQYAWYAFNINVCEFLDSVPDEQKLRIRGEDLLQDPDRGLREIAAWMGLRTDIEAIEEMKHPERSPYACFGPPGARFGNDRFFLERPALRPERAEPHTLVGPLPWREDGRELMPEVIELARQFGYR
jgi:hypothetical protein